jgi:hypothetical protein
MKIIKDSLLAEQNHAIIHCHEFGGFQSVDYFYKILVDMDTT